MQQGYKWNEQMAGGKPVNWREFRGGEEGRRARMLVWTLKCAAGAWGTERALEASVSFGLLVGTADNRLSLPPFGLWGNGVSVGPDSIGTEARLPCRVSWRVIRNFITEAAVGRGQPCVFSSYNRR